MNINEFAVKVHENAKNKGWHNNTVSPLEFHALFHSEISEATEEVRNGKDYLYFEDRVPKGEAVELADVVIRIADYFSSKGWNLEQILQFKMDYNETRSFRHGNKCY